MQPYFSVVIPLYNKEKYIEKTLESVLNQSFKDFEIIIVDDGSTDNSIDKIQEISDERLTIYNQENQGASVARNYGIELCKTDYIAFLDADDLWHKNHLEILHKLIEDYPNAGMYSTGYLIAFNSHSKKARIKNIPGGFIGLIPDFFDSSLYDSPVNSSTAVIKKDVLKQIDGYDLSIKSGQDIDLWIRIALREKVAIHNISTASYIKNDSSLSNSILAKEKIKYLNKFIDVEKDNHSLKNFMDMNRFSVAILYKILDEGDRSISIYKAIDSNNLSIKQRFTYHLPKPLLKLLYLLKKSLDKKGVFFHLYR